MDDPTSLLFGLDGFVVLEVADVAGEDATVRVVVETEPGDSNHRQLNSSGRTEAAALARSSGLL